MDLTFENLTKQYKDKLAVDHVSMEMNHGVWGLLGANGAGKTTLMRMIAGILKPTAGRVLYDGIDIRDLGASYRDVFGYLPQTFGFYPEFKVTDYLQYMGALKGLPEKLTNERIESLLHSLTLYDVRNKHIRKLSGGMQRRVGIAQALLNEPDILILDEPTSGLDPGERVRLRNILSEFAHDRLVLISTHIVSDVEYVATCNAIMKDGRILETGTTEELVCRMEGRVWKAVIRAEDLPQYERKYRVVNVKNEADDELAVRYLAEEPEISGSAAAEPRLEDLYLWLFPESEVR